VTDFAAVDAGDARELVAMMDATDAWLQVRAVREWVLDRSAVSAGALVVDVGCGPGTFGATAVARGATAIDVDASLTMLHAARRRGTECTVLGDVSHLALREACAHLIRAERVLQWTADPMAALDELWRVAAPDGWLAVTETDWGTLVVDHPDQEVTARIATAALRWVPHPRVAQELPTCVAALDVETIDTRLDTVTLHRWDPDDPAERDGPPGLPLRAIAPHDVDAIDAVAEHARAGTFHAELTLVTVLARTVTARPRGSAGRGAAAT
jgi:SAM-dependent methyltransferase